MLAEGLLVILSLSVAPWGDAQLAAHSIAIRISSLTAVFAIGFSIAASTRVSFHLARNDTQNAKVSYLCSIIIAFVFAATISLVMLVFKDDLLNLIFGTQNRTSTNTVLSLLPLLAFYQIVNSLMTVNGGALVGLSDTKIPAVIVFACTWIFGLALGLFFANILDLKLIGLWLGVGLGELAVIGLTTVRFFKLLSKNRP